MARFIGNVGFASSEVTAPGVFTDVITKRRYKGKIVRNNRLFNADDQILGEFSVSHSISVIADEYAISHLQQIKFVEWDGGIWVAATVEIQRPRLILGLGGVYNGPTA